MSSAQNEGATPWLPENRIQIAEIGFGYLRGWISRIGINLEWAEAIGNACRQALVLGRTNSR